MCDGSIDNLWGQLKELSIKTIKPVKNTENVTEKNDINETAKKCFAL